MTLLRGTVIQRGAGGPGLALFIPFAPAGYRSRMLTVEPESVTELMNSVPVMPSELLAEGAAVGSPLGTEGSPLGTEDSLKFSPPDQGSEESAPAEAVPATDPVPAPHEEDMADTPADGELAPPPQRAAQEADPVPAPQEEDMPEAPADAEDRPAAPADVDAAPPPPPTECGRGGRPHSRRDPPASLLRVAGCAAVGPPDALHVGHPPPAGGDVCGVVPDPHRPRAPGAHG